MNYAFQSPRTGKFESNYAKKIQRRKNEKSRFNPLERGNSNQICIFSNGAICWCFRFQSPRTGKFESNQALPSIHKILKEKKVSIP